MIIFILSLGAIVASIAPFLHIFFSKESEIKVFGFTNARMFFYAVGIPITLFICSIILSFISNFITIKEIAKASGRIAYVFLSIASYYIIWTIWARGDFPPFAYYSMIVIVACSVGFFISKFLKIVSSSSFKLLKISDKIPDLDKRIKKVNDLAKIMPDDNEITVTYKALFDVTADNLKETITEIKKDLN